jgi:hypothetical protein
LDLEKVPERQSPLAGFEPPLKAFGRESQQFAHVSGFTPAGRLEGGYPAAHVGDFRLDVACARGFRHDRNRSAHKNQLCELV